MNNTKSERIVVGGEVSKRRAKYLLSIDRTVVVKRVDGETKYFVGLDPKEPKEVH